MVSKQRHTRLVKEIEKKYGRVIDLKRSPSVLIEILREFGHIFAGGEGQDPDPGIGGTGGVGGVTGVSVSSIAGSPQGVMDIDVDVLFKAILTMQKDVRALSRKLDRLNSTR